SSNALFAISRIGIIRGTVDVPFVSLRWSYSPSHRSCWRKPKGTRQLIAAGSISARQIATRRRQSYLLRKQSFQLISTSFDPPTIRGIDDPYQSLSLFEIVPPVGPQC